MLGSRVFPLLEEVCKVNDNSVCTTSYRLEFILSLLDFGLNVVLLLHQGLGSSHEL